QAPLVGRHRHTQAAVAEPRSWSRGGEKEGDSRTSYGFTRRIEYLDYGIVPPAKLDAVNRAGPLHHPHRDRRLPMEPSQRTKSKKSNLGSVTRWDHVDLYIVKALNAVSSATK